MKKRLYVFFAAVAWFIISVFAVGCSAPEKGESARRVTVVVEDSPYYSCEQNVVHAEKGADVCITLVMSENAEFVSVDYPDYDAERVTYENTETASITLHSVKYSTVVGVRTARKRPKPPVPDEPEPDDPIPDEPEPDDEPTLDPSVEIEITYHSDDGTERVIRQKPSDRHLRFNTLSARYAFERDGYIQTGWNTKADGGGDHIGFGSRYGRYDKELSLYAEWAKENDEADFEYKESNGGAVITSYVGERRGAHSHGKRPDVVIPQSLGGSKVRAIAGGAFANCAFGTIVFPSTLKRIERFAFNGVAADKVYIFDDMEYIAAKAFMDFKLTTLYVNALRNPGYCGTYFDTFPDKCDRLFSLAGKNKIVLACGSSARFGYDSELIDAAFGDYEVVNMGVFAYTDMLPQFMIMNGALKRGDILLSTPEFDAVKTQFCATYEIDRAIFAMVETNYDLFTLVDCRLFKEPMRGFADHILCGGSENGSYDISPSDYDEDGIAVDSPSYNKYGDYTVWRKNNDAYEIYGADRAGFNVKYFPQEYIDSINSAYKAFTDKGVTVLYGYSPRSNISLSADSDYGTICELDAYLKAKLNVPVIGDIHESLMDAYYFYLTNNHLSTDGVSVHTDIVISDLKAYLATAAQAL